MSTTPSLILGSVWWSIRPVMEGYDRESPNTPPVRVKLWRRGESDALSDIWRASSFSAETGEVDDDSNATRIHYPRDVGDTLFADEAAAWAAYLGEPPTPQGIAAELEDRAAALECESAKRSPFAGVHAAALREAAGLLREAEERAARWARHPREETRDAPVTAQRARRMRQAMGLYEACLFAMGCDDTRETEEDVQEAARRGFVRPNSLTGELELSPDGEALVDAVGEAKARAAQEGPVVWPGAAVDVVLGWPARPASEDGHGKTVARHLRPQASIAADIAIPGGKARPAMTVGAAVVQGEFRVAADRGGGFFLQGAAASGWTLLHRSPELEVYLDGAERVVIACPDASGTMVAVVVPDAVWCAREEAQ